MPFQPGGWIHGSTLTKDRKVRYLSVSQMTQAEDCTRRWWYEKVGGKKPPDTEWQTKGTELHAELERYLKTGEKRLSSLAMSGYHMLPDPGDDLLIERDLLVRLDYSGPPPTRETSQWFIDQGPLKASGITVLGQFDLAHERGVNKGGSDIEATIDPPGTIEVIDWKTASDFKWAKTGPELIDSIQMAGYGKWFLNQLGDDVKHIRLSHGYFRTKGAAAARKSTILVSPEQIHESWEHVEGIARLIVNAATAERAEDVQYNLSACDKYRGCPHRSYCTAGMDAGVSVILGLTQSDALKPTSSPTGLIPMGSLLSRTKSSASAPAVTAPTPDAIALEKAKLEAAEKAGRLKRLVPAGMEKVCADIRSLNVGFPTLKGKAAVAYAALGGQEVADDFEFPGTGTYSYVEIDDAALLTQLLGDLKEELAKSPSASPLPPDAPASDPKLAFKEEVPTDMATASVDPMKLTDPQTVISDFPATMTIAKKTRTKAPKAEVHDVAAAADLKVNIFIDCRPSSAHEDLYNWVNEIADRIASNYKGIDKEGKIIDTVDLRAAPANSGAGFDNWKGILFAMCRSEEHTPLKPGNYYIDTRGSAIREIAADALKERAEKSGGMYVRSAR